MHRSAIQNHGGGTIGKSFGPPDRGTQITGHFFEAPRRNPALRVLVHRRPLRETCRQHAPLGTGMNDPAQRVVHLSDRVAKLWRIPTIKLRYGATNAHS